MSIFRQKSSVISTLNVQINESLPTEDVCVVHKMNKVESEKRQRVVKFSRSTIVPITSSYVSSESFGTSIKRAFDLNVPYIDKSPIVLGDEDVSERKNVKTNNSVLKESAKLNKLPSTKWSFDHKLYKVLSL